MFVVCNSFSQSHPFPGGTQNPLLYFQCGLLVCVLYEADLPAAISPGVFQTSELPVSLFPVSLIKSYCRVWAAFENIIPGSTPTWCWLLADAHSKSLLSRGLSITVISLTREERRRGSTFTRQKWQNRFLLCYLSVLKIFLALRSRT